MYTFLYTIFIVIEKLYKLPIKSVFIFMQKAQVGGLDGKYV